MANNKEREQILEEKLKKIKEELSVIKKKNMAKERKARTKRLIELGAIIEKKFSPETIEVFRYLPKDNLEIIEKWCLEHHAEAERIKAESQAKLVKKQPEPQAQLVEEKKEEVSADTPSSRVIEDDDTKGLSDFLKNSPGTF